MSDGGKRVNPCYRALGILLLLVLGLNLAVTWPWLRLNGDYNEALSETSDQVRRFQNLQAQGPQIQAQLESLDREVGGASFYVDADTPALAAAALQKQVKTAVDGAGGKLTSTQNLPQKEEGNAQRVAILVRMSGDVDALFKVLYPPAPARHQWVLTGHLLRIDRLFAGERRVKTLLALLSLVLSLLFLAELWWYLGRDRQLVPPPARAAVSATQKAVLPPKAAFKLPDEANYEDVLERPLFVEGRRPPSDEPKDEEPEAEQQDLPPPKLSLVGVYVTPKGSTALVRNDATRDTVRVRLGDRFDGWEVTQIDDARLVLKKRGDEHVFELRDYSKPAPPPKNTTPRRVGARKPASARRLPAALNRKK